MLDTKERIAKKLCVTIVRMMDWTAYVVPRTSQFVASQLSALNPNGAFPSGEHWLDELYPQRGIQRCPIPSSYRFWGTHISFCVSLPPISNLILFSGDRFARTCNFLPPSGVVPLILQGVKGTK